MASADAKRRVMRGRPRNVFEYSQVLSTLQGPERQWAKAANLGWLYGMTSDQVRESVSVKELFKGMERRVG